MERLERYHDCLFLIKKKMYAMFYKGMAYFRVLLLDNP